MDVSTKQLRIAEIARKYRGEAIVALNHHLDLDWLRVAFDRTRKDGAAGIDGVTAEEYAEHLEANLASLLERAKSGRYVAPPVRRTHIPKGGGKETRPIGIPTLEDKILQRAIVMLLEPIYETEFLDVSYGFRRKRSAHQALERIWHQTMGHRIGWILDVDIRKYFDTIDHGHLREIIRQRVRDGVITRLIGKWLKAGVWEKGSVRFPEEGAPQGGVISPLLSNIYLHEVLDQWFIDQLQPLLKGRSFLVRFADDFVMGFEHQADAERVLAVLPKRFGKYGLRLHPEKTRLVRFERPTGGDPRKPETFNFLGFTHYWGKSRKGRWVLKRKTAQDRFTRGQRKIRDWCRTFRHLPMKVQFDKLCQKLQGHYGYFGITGNSRWLQKFREEAKRTWRKWLNRRSRKGNDMPWERFNELLKSHYRLPAARVVHSIYAAKP